MWSRCGRRRRSEGWAVGDRMTLVVPASSMWGHWYSKLKPAFCLSLSLFIASLALVPRWDLIK
jgi:hypothetical protein